MGMRSKTNTPEAYRVWANLHLPKIMKHILPTKPVPKNKQVLVALEEELMQKPPW